MLVDVGSRPSPQAFIVALLTANLQVPVSTKIPDTRPERFITVQRVGGSMRNLVTDRVQLAVQAWAESEVYAERLCIECEAVLSASVCTPFRGAMIRHFREVTAPLSFPDVSGQPRYQAMVEFDLAVH